MAKPVINYKGYVTENPADRTVGVHGPLGRGADASAGVHAGALGLAEQGRLQGREDDRGRRRRAGHRVQPVRRHEGGLAAGASRPLVWKEPPFPQRAGRHLRPRRWGMGTMRTTGTMET